jgi:hypothetical protein
MDIELAIDMVHAPGVEEDQRNEDVDGALLCEPETELEAANADAIQLFDKEYTEAVGAGKPDDEADSDEAQIGAPVRKSVLEMHHNPQIMSGLL